MSGRLLVTGSNRGTGLAIATLFGERGFRIASLNRTRLGKPWLGEIVCDLSRGAEIGPACDAALAHLGGVDVCILNAAVRQIHRIEDMTDADWDESVATNLSAVFKIMRRMLPALKASRGHLVILGSQAGEHFFEGGAAYCATKAALVALAEVAVLETRGDGVRCTLVTAGAIHNRDKGNDGWKIEPASVERVIYDVVQRDASSFVGHVGIRPARVPKSPVVGLARLQHL